MNIALREIQLASGEILPIGINMYAMQLMTRFPGGLKKLEKDITKVALADPEDDSYGEALAVAMDAMAYMLWALVRAGGTQCTQEQSAQAISLDDFTVLHEIFEEFSESAKRMGHLKNPMSRVGSLISRA